MNIHRYPLRSDPNAVLVPMLRTHHWVRNNLVSATTSDVSMTMSTDSQSSDVPPDPTAQAPITDTLSHILGQLTTINMRLELQGEAIVHHDKILDGSSGSVAPPQPPNNTIEKDNPVNNGSTPLGPM
jgi:hypothetical protein